jgi:hypothetical protein
MSSSAFLSQLGKYRFHHGAPVSVYLPLFAPEALPPAVLFAAVDGRVDRGETVLLDVFAPMPPPPRSKL